ncbi:MAG: entericidin EcnA/B family protein [Candidatus Omnitrophica bacterium]|nr:entericidin EcnA/B family protein [Candidatus Omnitrophota bacterium]MDD5437087.1 entericidin EcnA/B family protein [Candidatus Omnitrophota bacterium]
MKKIAMIITMLLVTAAVLSGCGETVSGVGKDVNRMGRGISTFFFRQ